MPRIFSYGLAVVALLALSGVSVRAHGGAYGGGGGGTTPPYGGPTGGGTTPGPGGGGSTPGTGGGGTTPGGGGGTTPGAGGGGGTTPGSGGGGGGTTPGTGGGGTTPGAGGGGGTTPGNGGGGGGTTPGTGGGGTTPGGGGGTTPGSGGGGHGVSTTPGTGGGGGGTTPAAGGGGGYTGPVGGGGTTPGSGGGGGSGYNGPAGGGGSSPAAGGAPHAPTTGAPRGGGAPGGGHGAPAGSTRGNATPRTKAKEANDHTQEWEFWWEMNDDRFVNLKAKLRAATAAPSNLEGGSNELARAANTPQLTAQRMALAVAPIIDLALKDAYFDARAAAAIALGKTCTANQTERVRRLLPLLADVDSQVRESACLGLGLTGDKMQIPLLLDIMKNTSIGRQACGRGTNDIEPRARAFAAMAVGLIGNRERVDDGVIRELVTAMATPKPDRDLQVAPALALGIMRSSVAVPRLQDIVKNQDNDADEVVRAHAVIALGKLGDRSAVKLLTECLDDRRVQVARSAAIALGMLTARDDDATTAALIDHARSASDRAVRNFALIALGEIGNASGRDHLLATLAKGRGADVSYAAIALGVYGFPAYRIGERGDIGARVLAAWNATRGESERGACAIALGLLDYKPAAKPLTEALAAGSSPALRGHLCTALALVDARDALPLIEAEAKQGKDLDLQRRAAIALGLLRDPDATKILQGVVDSATDNLSVLGSAAVALGFVGDRQAVDTLTKLVSTSPRGNARAFAVVALGVLADKDSSAALTAIQMNCNYLAATPSMMELLTIY